METPGFCLLVPAFGTGDKSLYQNPLSTLCEAKLSQRACGVDHLASNPGILRLFRRQCIIMAAIRQSPKG